MSSKNQIIQAIESAQLKTDIPAFGAGDTVVVQVKVKEGTRERLQASFSQIFIRLCFVCINRKALHYIDE